MTHASECVSANIYCAIANQFTFLAKQSPMATHWRGSAPAFPWGKVGRLRRPLQCRFAVMPIIINCQLFCAAAYSLRPGSAVSVFSCFLSCRNAISQQPLSKMVMITLGCSITPSLGTI